MFQKRRGQIAAILMLMSVSSQPMLAHAGEPATPPATTQAAASAAALTGGPVDGFRHDMSAKFSETQGWVKSSIRSDRLRNPVRTLDLKIDRLQGRVKPAGRSIRAAVSGKIPGKRWVLFGERTVSVYGLILMLAFGTLFLIMSLSSPMSRLGGRH